MKLMPAMAAGGAGIALLISAGAASASQWDYPAPAHYVSGYRTVTVYRPVTTYRPVTHYVRHTVVVRDRVLRPVPRHTYYRAPVYEDRYVVRAPRYAYGYGSDWDRHRAHERWQQERWEHRGWDGRW